MTVGMKGFMVILPCLLWPLFAGVSFFVFLATLFQPPAPFLYAFTKYHSTIFISPQSLDHPLSHPPYLPLSMCHGIQSQALLAKYSVSVCFDLTHTWPNRCVIDVFFSCFACVRAFCTVTSLLFSPKKKIAMLAHTVRVRKRHTSPPHTHTQRRADEHTNCTCSDSGMSVFMIPLPLIVVVLVNVLEWVLSHNAPGLGWGDGSLCVCVKDPIHPSLSHPLCTKTNRNLILLKKPL